METIIGRFLAALNSSSTTGHARAEVTTTRAAKCRMSVRTAPRILALATDFPRLWHDPHTPDRERKRMVRLLLDDVTLIKTAHGVTAHLRFRGGATITRTLPNALNAWQLRETSAEILALIDHLLDSHADGDIATILNARGYVSGTGQPFQRGIVKHLRHSHGLRSRCERLRARGMLTRDEIARPPERVSRHREGLGAARVTGARGLQRQRRMAL
jgi:hypothetical protein